MNARRRSRSNAEAGAGKVSLGSRLVAWRDMHLYSLFSSLGRLLGRPWASLLTIGVMAVALALPLGLMLGLDNLGRLTGDEPLSRQFALFLHTELDASGIDALAAQLRARPDVASVELRSPEQGLAEFREMTEFAGALDVLDGNPLPAVLRIEPTAEIDPQALADTLGELPQVDFVQYDAEWRLRLLAWLAFGRRLAMVVALLLGLGALLVVGNTVRLDIQGRAEEISIVQLLGATDGFVRRPFLYLGVWYGLAAGLLALLLVEIGLLALHGPLSGLTESYGSHFDLHGPGWLGALWVPLASALLGWLGAWLAAGHHLRAGYR